MKLDCVLTSTNDNPLYMDFIPIFIRTWKKLYPNVDVKIIFIGNSIPEKFNAYKDNIILFEPIPNILTAFISQYIRLLYPAILNYKNGVLITDMDMLPMNRTYYTKNIEKYSDDKFIYMRNVLLNKNQIAMCYNVATSLIWGNIFNIKSIDDIIKRINLVYSNNKYNGKHGGLGWSIDQKHLYNKVMNWNKNTKNLVILSDKSCNFRRLDRGKFNINNNQVLTRIKNGFYSDYHCFRPYKKFKNINEKIYNIL